MAIQIERKMHIPDYKICYLTGHNMNKGKNEVFFVTILNILKVGEMTVILRDWEIRRRLKEGDNELHFGHIKMKETAVKLGVIDIHYNSFTCSMPVCTYASVKGMLLVS